MTPLLGLVRALLEQSSSQKLGMPSNSLPSLAILGCVALALGDTYTQLLMVTGGYPYWNNVTLLSLDGGPPVPECLRDLNPHPKELFGSCSATLKNSKSYWRWVKSFKPLNHLILCLNRQTSTCLWGQQPVRRFELWRKR